MLGAIVGAIGDKDGFRAVGEQMARRQFAHLARAHQIHVLALQRSENLLGQFHRDRGHRHRRRTHGGFGAHPLGHGESAGQQQIELRVHRAHSAGRGIGFFHLSQNLRLAHHHGVQAGSHAKQVTDRLALAVFIQVRLVVGGIQLKVIAQKTAQVHRAIFGLGQHFHPVAGGEDHSFFHAGMPRQPPQRLGQPRLGDGQALAHFHRRGLVIHPDELKLHDWTNP